MAKCILKTIKWSLLENKRIASHCLVYFLYNKENLLMTIRYSSIATLLPLIYSTTTNKIPFQNSKQEIKVARFYAITAEITLESE